ncbi:MAG: histidine--tRNA ligase family protein [Chloroflexi bacterium]|nr:histidine--tRNA ligase family protein [Chloroflexota bacterium]
MQRPISHLPGTGDLAGPRLREHLALQGVLAGAIESWGYEPIDTPLLEEADLFLRKSGGELAARLYAVMDPGGRRVALRPEFTASVIRAFVALQNETTLPARWWYAGPVFRHQPPDQGERRQVTQVGAELIGAAGPLADAEVLAIACEGLQRAEVRGAVLTLGHLGVLGDFLLALGLSDRADLFLLSRLSALQDPDRTPAALLEEARLLRLTPGAGDELGPALTGLQPEEARAVVRHLVTSLGSAWVGSRTMAEVESRLLEKLQAADDPERLDRAVRFLSELVRVRGTGKAVLRQCEAVARRYGLSPQPLEPLASLVSTLADLPEMRAVQPVLDLGLARGLAYYTGFVFELSHPGLPGQPLGGGGRYNGLVRALGGRDVPALGFAYSLEALAEARSLEGATPLAGRAISLPSVVVPLGQDDGARALAEAGRLRATGAPVVLHPEPGDLEGARRLARRQGALSLVIVGPAGPRTEPVEVERDAAARPPQ